MSSAIVQFAGEHRFLSNFDWFEIDGVRSTAEHWFQAGKATTEADREYVLAAATPGSAKRRGRQIKLRPDWEDVKLSVMERVVRFKFSDPEYARKLVETGDAELVEGNTWGDRYWGVCDGEGENHLGKILMKVRAELVDASTRQTETD